MRLYFEYKGYTVFRQTEPGYCMRYTTRGTNGQLCANTQAEIKQLITEEVANT